MNSRPAFLLLPIFFFLGSYLRGQDVPSTAAEEVAVSSTEEGLRVVNLLSFRGESSLILDGKIVVRNIVRGDILSDLKSAPGPHQIQIEPLSGGKPILSQAFNLPARANVTLVLTGGHSGLPSDRSQPTTPSVIALTPPPKAKADPTPSSSAPTNPPCQLLILNADPRGSLRVSAKAGDQAKTLTIASGKTESLDSWPIAPLDLSAVSAKPFAGAEAPAELNLFTPAKPTSYYCILYAPSSTSPVRALFLAADGGRDLGRERVDER